VPTWLGAHAVPPEHDGRGRLPRLRARRGPPDAAQLAEAADVFLERGAFDALQAPALSSKPAAEHGLVSCGSTATSSREAGAIPARDRARRALGRPPRGDGSRRGSRRWPQRRHRAVLLPRAPSSSIVRCLPHARLSMRAQPVALATDFNPR
jgi:imidazolonepropionase